MPGNPRIRASDADRDRTAALLREHHAEGRLTAEEFGERMDLAMEARTLGELDELLEDLPVIDLYKLPDASLRRRPPRPGGASLLPADWPRGPGTGGVAQYSAGAVSPGAVSPGAVAVGAWAAVTAGLIAIWAVAAVVAGGTWFPWWALIVLPWIWVLARRPGRRGK